MSENAVLLNSSFPSAVRSAPIEYRLFSLYYSSARHTALLVGPLQSLTRGRIVRVKRRTRKTRKKWPEQAMRGGQSSSQPRRTPELQEVRGPALAGTAPWHVVNRKQSEGAHRAAPLLEGALVVAMKITNRKDQRTSMPVLYCDSYKPTSKPPVHGLNGVGGCDAPCDPMDESRTPIQPHEATW